MKTKNIQVLLVFQNKSLAFLFPQKKQLVGGRLKHRSENKKYKRGREKLKHLLSLVNGNAYDTKKV